MGWREALVVAVAVPVAFGLTLAANQQRDADQDGNGQSGTKFSAICQTFVSWTAR